MLQNYFKIALRNALRNRMYLLVNVAGLGLSLAFSTAVYMLFAYNFEFDNHFDTADIYRVNEWKNGQRRVERFDFAPIPMAAALREQFPGITATTRYIGWNAHLRQEQVQFEQRVAFVDPNFMEFFPHTFIKGAFTATSNHNRIFLTEKLANKFFNGVDPVGKTLTLFMGGDKRAEVEIAGILKDHPFNSSFYFDAVADLSLFTTLHQIDETRWDHWIQASTFVKIPTPTMAKELSGQMGPFVERNNQARETWQYLRMEIVPFKDPSLTEDVVYGAYTNFRNEPVVLYIFGLIGFLILLLACFNLANTSVALMGKRMREIGVRKVLGGTTRLIFGQFFFEMLFINVLGLLFGILLAQVIVPEFWALWGVDFQIESLSYTNMIVASCTLLLVISLLAGIYPALYSKSFQPVDIFRKSLKMRGTSLFNRVLITSQFAITIILLIVATVFWQNAHFIKGLDLGFDKSSLIVVPLNEPANYEALRYQLTQQSEVEAVAGSQCHLRREIHRMNLSVDTGKVEVQAYLVGERYMETMGFRLKEGRFLNAQIPSDSVESVLVNATFVQRFGYENPIGKMVRLNDKNHFIVGVVENVVEDIYEGAEAKSYVYKLTSPADYHFLVIKTSPENRKQVQELAQVAWQKTVPGAPYLGEYQEDMSLKTAARDSRNLQVIFLYLGLLGGALSVAGIFSLVSLNVNKRTKEIGIRKVLGASARSIVGLINREFLILLGVALALGATLGFLASDALLDIVYAVHLSIQLWHLLLAAGLVLGVAILTTSSTILRAAQANPSQSLKTE